MEVALQVLPAQAEREAVEEAKDLRRAARAAPSLPAAVVRLETQWCQGWIERIAEIYRLNEVRLEHYDPGLKRQTPAFDATQAALMEALDGLFADAREELAALPDQAREGKALRSLLNHREGLCVFVGRPQTPMDNNRTERFLARDGSRTRVVVRLQQREGCRVHRDHVLGAGHALDERHRRPALAERVADGVRGEWPPTAGRPVALAALDDERGAQARTHGAGMTAAIECRYYGRDFTTDEMALLRALIATDPQPTRATLSREFCRRIGWLKSDGASRI